MRLSLLQKIDGLTMNSTEIDGVKNIIEQLSLIEHVEGGYFSETYRSTTNYQMPYGDRSTMTSIFYLLTQNAGIGHFHMNRSDIMHYFHQGDPIDYYILTPNGELTVVTMGNDLVSGHVMQLMVPGGVWKASKLKEGLSGYGLIGEAVAPGFDFDDMQLGDYATMLASFPQHKSIIDHLFER